MNRIIEEDTDLKLQPALALFLIFTPTWLTVKYNEKILAVVLLKKKKKKS